MAQYCDKNDGHIVCDFCAHFFFGIDHSVYRGNGYCLHPNHSHKERPGGGCDDYKCFRIDGRTEKVDKFEEKLEEQKSRVERLDKIAEGLMEEK